MIQPLNKQDWEQLRSRFPIFHSKTYINSCSYGALATEVEASLQRYLDARHSKGSDWEYWVGRNEAVRSSVARLLGAKPAEIAAYNWVCDAATASGLERPPKVQIMEDKV